MEPHYLRLIKEGLPRAECPQRVIVVGAGMAGLVAAYELLRAGHDPLILEAQARVGGRICTAREPFSEGFSAEVGAMRIPAAHRLTMAYIEKFGLKLAPFTLHNPRAYYHLYGRRQRISEVENDPARLGFALAERERGRSVTALWEEALRPICELIQAQGEAAWNELAARYDRCSVRGFLEESGWSEGAIELFGLLLNQESLMNSGFLELLREEVGDYYRDLWRIVGGTDQLPNAFLPSLAGRIRFGARVTAIDQRPDGVTVHYRTLAGAGQACGDRAILAIPFAVLRHVEILKPFSQAKQRAIRELHYDSAAKILLQCRRRFWEEDEGIQGGWTVSDLPIRNLFYFGAEGQTRRGILLASYTWGEDARRWGSLPSRERIVQAIENVAQIHPQIRAEFEVGLDKVWDEDEFAGGAFALFDPGQQSLLYLDIIAPEGRIHFAGEHASLTHGWIQGAIESGLRVAKEVTRQD